MLNFSVTSALSSFITSILIFLANIGRSDILTSKLSDIKIGVYNSNFLTFNPAVSFGVVTILTSSSPALSPVALLISPTI